MTTPDDLVKLARECGAMELNPPYPGDVGQLQYAFTVAELAAFASRITAQKDAEVIVPGEEDVMQRWMLYTFLDVAADKGYVLGGVDAAELFEKTFPDQYAFAAAPQPAPVQQALTDEQKRELLGGCGFITGANFETPTGRLYRSIGIPSNVWEVSLFELIERARAYPLASQAREPEWRGIDSARGQLGAWMDPQTRDVISSARKADWMENYGTGGAIKAKSYTVALYFASPPQAEAPKEGA